MARRTKQENRPRNPRYPQEIGGYPQESDESKPAEKPLSLRPLEFEEAVRGLLRVKPDENEPQK